MTIFIYLATIKLMSKSLLRLAIILIIILIGIWGYYFYAQSSRKNIQTPSKVSTSPEPTKSIGQKSTNQALSFNDERLLLTYMDIVNPTDDQKIKFREVLEKFAKLGDSVSISKCEATPIALKVKIGTEIKVTNKDSIDYTIRLAGKGQYTLSAKQTIIIKSDDFGVGIHGYRCEGKDYESQPVAGILDIVE